MSWSSLPALAVTVALSASADPLVDGYAWLRAQQDLRGAFGATTGENETVSTHEALEALAASSQSQTPEAENARIFLALLPAAADHELTVRRSMALEGTPFGLSPPLLVTHAAGFEALEPWVSAWSLLEARRRDTVNRSDLQALARTLVTKALPSGCFEVADNGASVELTALMIRALRSFQRDAVVGLARSAALQCLQGLQDAGGSFGTVEATASAALAFLEADLVYEPVVSASRSYLLAVQRPNGSFGAVRATALSLQALGGAVDWELSPREFGRSFIILSANERAPGEPIEASVLVTNKSNIAAAAVPVEFRAVPLAGGATVVLAGTTVAALPPGQARRAAAVLATGMLSGRYRLEAEVDPLRLFPELDRTNNVAVAYVNIIDAVDVAVSTAGITFTPAGPASVTANVRVRSLGIATPVPVTVEVRKGSASSGVVLGAFTIPSGLVRNVDFTGSVTFSNAGFNGFTAIWAVADSTGALDERNEENNLALRFYENGAEGPVDVQVLGSDFSVQGGTAIVGQLTTVNGRVRNLAPRDANRFQLTLFDTAGAPLASVEIESLAAGASVPVSLSFVVPGALTARVVADSASQLNDTNRANNTLTMNIGVAVATNLTVTGLFTTSITAQNGIPVTLTVNVSSVGPSLSDASLRVTEEGEGVTELSTVRVQLDRNEGRSLSLGPFVTPNRGSVYRVCIDPFGVVEETNEHDNCKDLSLGTQATNVTMTSRDLTMTPVGAAVGEKVTFTATVHNTSAVPAHGVVEWWQGGPGQSYGTPLAEQLISVPASSTRTVSFDVIRDDGVPEISARLTRITPRNLASNVVQGGRHFFLEQLVDLDFPDTSGPFTQLVRVGRLTGRAAPELVLGLEHIPLGVPFTFEVMVLERGSTGYQPMWSHTMPGLAQDIALIDLDSDGTGEVVALSGYELLSSGGRQHNLAVLSAAGAVRWAAAIPLVVALLGGPRANRLGFTDYDSDGVVDIASAVERLQVRSGRDGGMLLDVPFSSFFGTWGSVTPLDVTGDGEHEFLVYSETSFSALYSHGGQLLWTSERNGLASGSGAVLDMNFDGEGEFIESGLTSQSYFVDLATHSAVSSAVGFVTLDPVVGGPLRQDGLAYALFAPWNAGRLVAARGDFSEAWNQPMRPTFVNSGDVDLQLTLADLEGRGRPQLVGFSCYTTFLLVDGRTGKPAIPYPDSVGTQCTRGGGSIGNFAHQPPVVADLAGDGQGSYVVLSHTEAGFNPTNATGAPQYGRAEALIFHSSRWKKMPPTWPTHSLVKGRIGDDLKLLAGADSFQWWKSHNTYNQQFDLEPARLLPDFTVSMPLQGPATANQSFAVVATLKNEGGLPASNVRVAFWDGHPADGGTRLGATLVGGPLAARTGQSPAGFTWNAWPEGRHTLCAVANEGGAMEESGDENNIACATVIVRTPAQACDLELVTSSLDVSPEPAAAGDILTLSATVRNIGVLGCEATMVSFADGLQAPRAPLPALAPNATQAVVTSAVAFPGTRVFEVTVDPDALARDADRGNNVSTITSNTAAATAPDLAVLLAAAQPQPAFPGETIQLSATLSNLGAPALASRLQFQMGGQTVDVDVPPLAPGEQLVVTAPLTAPAGTLSGTARADVGGVLAELDETNNTATFGVGVVSPELTMTATATPSSAGPDAPVGLTVTLTNARPTARELTLSVELISAIGASVASVSGPMRVVAGPGHSGLTLPWNTGRTAPGAYAFDVRVQEAGRDVTRAQAPFTVLAESATQAAIAVDRGHYAPRETVVILAGVENASRNAALTGAVATVTLFDPLNVVLQSTTRPLPALPALGRLHFSDSHVLSPMATAGTYRVVHEVRDGAGALASSVVATFELRVVPALNIKAQTTVAPVFPITPPLPVRVALTNTSSADLPSGVLSLELFDIAGLQLLAPESTASRGVSLTAGATRTDDFLLPTAGIQPGPKLLVTRLDGVILQRLRIEAVAVTDTEPPIIDITGVFDLQVSRFNLTPLITIIDFSVFTSTSLLDGAPFISGTTVTTEGVHVLQVTATDVFGNSAFRAVRFTIDKTPPVLTLSGVANGAFSPNPVTLTWTVADATPTTVVATLNGTPLQSGDTASAEGTYVWTVTATDAAGNSSAETRQFVLDFTAPLISIAGVSEGAFRSSPVPLTFTVTDSSPTMVAAALDGAPFASGGTVSAEGPHTLLVTATDAAGNSAVASRSFTLDFTAPVISIAGVVGGALYATPRTITFAASDASPATAVATLDGAPFTSGSTVSADGSHVLVVTATDAAGNSAQQSVQFSIDRTPPVIAITGVSEGATGATFTPVIAVADASPTTVTAALDAAPFVSGTTVSSLGPHTLSVTATDAAGNTASAVVHFTVSAAPSNPIFQFGVCATGSLTVRNSAQSTGSLAANGPVTLENSALVLGDVVAGGNLSLRNSARITGRGRYGGTLSVANSAVVQGGTARVVPAPSPCQCSYDVGAELLAAAQTNDNAAIASTLTGGGLDLRNSNLMLPGGTYHLTFIRLRNRSTLSVAPGQTARLFVEHSVQVENTSTLGSSSGEMLVVSGADNLDGGFIELENATDTRLRLYAPRADIRLQNSARLTGAVVGRSLTLQNSHRLVSDAQSDGGLHLVCP